MKKKLKLLLICVPFYPVALIGEWYECHTMFVSKKFSFKGTTKEYWTEVSKYLKDDYK